MADYRFRKGGGMDGKLNRPVNGPDAAIVGSRLETIRGEQGKLTPAVVVNDARPADAVLHPYFEWNNELAAEKFRHEQASTLIRAVHVVMPSDSGKAIVTRAFVSVDQNEDARYEPVATVLNDAVLYLQVCRRACAELAAFQDRYAQFSSLKSIGKAATDAAQVELAAAISNAEVAA